MVKNPLKSTKAVVSLVMFYTLTNFSHDIDQLIK